MVTNKKIIVYLIILFGYAVSIAGVILTFLNANIVFSVKSILYAGFAGLLGSVIYMNRGFYQNIVGKDGIESFNFEKWIWWYLSRPILGFVVGSISFLIVYLAFDLDATPKNQIGFYLLGFLSGYNFHNFMEDKICNKINL